MKKNQEPLLASFWLMPFLILAWGLFSIFFLPIIPINGGFGYDGAVIYGPLAMNFDSISFWQSHISDYSIQRILPSFCVNSMMKLFSMEFTVINTVKVFQYYNLILLTASTLVYVELCRIMKLRPVIGWIGFILLFINFNILKVSFWNPVLCDTTAFFLGMLLAYGFYTNDLILKLLVLFLGAFTWPTMSLVALILCVFPKKNNAFNKEVRIGTNHIFGLLAAVAFAGTFLWFYLHRNTLGEYNVLTYFNIRPFMFIGMAGTATLIYLFVSFNSPEIHFNKNTLPELIKNIFSISFLLTFMAMGMVMLMKYLLLTHYEVPTNTLKEGFNPLYLPFNLSVISSNYPLNYIVESISSAGLMFFFFYYLILKKEFKSLYPNWGIGIYLILLLLFVLKLTPESRGVINLIPLLGLVLLHYLNKFKVSYITFIFITFSSLLLSKIYIPLEGIPIQQSSMWEFPNQYYFLNTYLMSGTSYAIQLSIIALLCAIYYQWFRPYDWQLNKEEI